MIGIIGAGPTGLAIAYLLKQRGVDFQIVERDSVGYTWKNQYEALRMNSLRDVSSLPGMEMPKSFPVFPSAAQFASYLEQYAKTFDFPIRTAEVKEINFRDTRFELLTNQATVNYRTVIIATGIWSQPYHPYADSSPFSGEVLHASQYRTADRFAGKRVLVVGSGASAGDLTVDLTKSASSVGMSIAHGVNIVQPITSVAVFRIFRAFFENDKLFKLIHPLLVKMRQDHSSIGLLTHPQADTQLGYSVIVGDELIQAVKAGKICPFPAFTGFTAKGAMFADQREFDFDAIIFATGYRPALQFARNCFEMDAAGYPFLNQFRSTKYTDVYFVGPSSNYGHAIGWLPSLKKAANAAVIEIVPA